MTFSPMILSADMNYDHNTMESDAVEYIRDLIDDEEDEKLDVCEHGNSYASNCSDCDEEVIEDTEYLEWYENWKKENFNNEKK